MEAATLISRGKSIAHLIAWLSLCLLAAGWGSSIDPTWRPLWRQGGAFGLASAVGLQAAARFRAMRKRRVELEACEQLLDRRLSNVISQSEIAEAVRGVVGQICEDIERRVPLGARRTEPASALRHAVQLAPMKRHADESTQTVADAEECTAYIRNISTTGIGLLHREPLAEQLYLMTYDLRSGERLFMAIEIRWCKPLSETWYSSGARFVDVVSEQAIEGKLCLSGAR